jgi:hypothetical protein
VMAISPVVEELLRQEYTFLGIDPNLQASTSGLA